VTKPSHPNIIFTHPTGNANVRAVANSFLAKNLLYRFYTSFAAFPGNLWYQLGEFPFLSDFHRRKFNRDLSSLTKQYPLRELGRLFATKMGLKKLTEHESGIFSIDQVYRSLDSYVANDLSRIPSSDLSAVYAYEDGALKTFRKAKSKGIKCIYDLPIAYWETKHQLITEEKERLPAWTQTLGGIQDSTEKLNRKEEELRLADVIIGPGSFVMDSLPAWAKKKRKIISPFGSPQTQANIINFDIEKERPLRVLFVGSMGQRKGLADLFEAMHQLTDQNIELIILGSPLAPMEFYREEYPKFIHKETRPHAEVLKLMRSCDVFCLPSIVEGRALVMQEAMSQGLPIIITPNTGGADLVAERETGFLIPIRSPEAIAEKLVWFSENRDRIPKMGRKAQKVSQKYTWEKYGDKISNDLIEYLNNE